MKVSKTFVGKLAVSLAIVRYCMCAMKFLKFSRTPAPARRLLDPVRTIDDVVLLECCALCTDQSGCAAVNYRTETRSCELIGATWKENLWDDNYGWKMYRNVNVCGFIEYPGIAISLQDDGEYTATVDDCKTHCWEENDGIHSFDYRIAISTCYCNTVSVLDAMQTGTLLNDTNWVLYNKVCEP